MRSRRMKKGRIHVPVHVVGSLETENDNEKSGRPVKPSFTLDISNNRESCRKQASLWLAREEDRKSERATFAGNSN